MCVLSIKVPIRKKSENLFNYPRINAKKLYTYLCPSVVVSARRTVFKPAVFLFASNRLSERTLVV